MVDWNAGVTSYFKVSVTGIQESLVASALGSYTSSGGTSIAVETCRLYIFSEFSGTFTGSGVVVRTCSLGIL